MGSASLANGGIEKAGVFACSLNCRICKGSRGGTVVASLTDVPLVMHGGSGLPDRLYGRIVAAGISNIHFYSAVAMDAWRELKKKIGDDDQYPPYHEVVAHSLAFFEESTKHLIALVGSKGRAGDF